MDGFCTWQRKNSVRTAYCQKTLGGYHHGSTSTTNTIPIKFHAELKSEFLIMTLQYEVIIRYNSHILYCLFKSKFFVSFQRALAIRLICNAKYHNNVPKTKTILISRYTESIQNSFGTGDTYKLFLRMLYQLLLSGKWPFKRKKMMCVGPPDSGKTTWIVPILEVINRQHLATCTDEGKFSCQSLTSLTEMLWLEEWELGITLVTNCLFGCLCVCVCL